MVKLNEIARRPYPRERKFRRFSLRYPVHVKFHSGTSIAQLDAVSNNVSIGGLLLETASLIPPHSLVSFVMTVHGGRMIRPIQLRGEGEVVRVEAVEAKGRDAGFAIAVECKHPVTQIEEHIPVPAAG